MKIERRKSFKDDWKNLPKSIRTRAEKKLKLFLTDVSHPSLRVHKMEGHKDIWEASITDNYRFTFEVEGDTYILRRIGTHDTLRKP